MAKRKRKSKVFYNAAVDTWSNDSMTEPYLMPGTEAYEAYKEQLKKQFDKTDDNDAELEDAYDKENDKKIKKQSDDMSVAQDVAKHKFRKQQSKVRQNKDIEKIVSNGLGKHVDITGGIISEYGLPGISNNDEVYDDGISADEYKSEVIKDYKKQLDAVEREMPSLKSDKDDAPDVTPGIKAMRKYM